MKKNNREMHLNGTVLKKYWIDVLFIVVTLSVLLYRIALAADRYDEIINLNISYAASLGRIPFLEGREAFQTGDLFIVPFLWLYRKIMGSSDGIVLFSRMLYFFAMCLLGSLVYYTFNKQFGKRAAFYLCYLCPFFQVYCLYYLWYDTSCIITLTVTLLLLYNGMIRRKKTILYLAGISAAALTFSYPTMALIAVLLAFTFFFDWVPMRERLTCFLSYCSGGLTVAALGVVIVCRYMGINRFIRTIQSILAGRSFNVGSLDSPFSIYSDICNSFLSLNSFLIVASIFLLGLFYKALSSKKCALSLVLGIVILSFINHNFFAPLVKNTFKTLNNFLGYIALWAPLLYFIPPNHTKEYKRLYIYIWAPSIFASVSIAMGTVYSFIGPVKSWEVFFPAALCSLLLMNHLFFEDVKELTLGKFSFRRAKNMLLPAICLLLLYNYTSTIYGMRDRPPFEKSRENSGIWAGIKVADSVDMRRNIWVEQSVKEPLLELENCHTIAVSGTLCPVYLMTDKKPFVNSVENLRWEYAIPYYEEFHSAPDILVLTADDYNEESSIFIDAHYVCWKTFQNSENGSVVKIFVLSDKVPS